MKATAIEAANGLTWRRQPSICRANHELLINGVSTSIWVIAVTHPTALRPYYVAEGENVSERKFSQVIDAKAAAVETFLRRVEEAA